MPEERDARSELLARLDWLIASLDSPSLIEANGWTAPLAQRYVSELMAFRHRVEDGTTTEKDKTMSWARALDFEGVGSGEPSFLAARVDDARRATFDRTL